MTVRTVSATLPNGIFNQFSEVEAESKSVKFEACVRLALARPGELAAEIAEVEEERHADHKRRSDALRG